MSGNLKRIEDDLKELDEKGFLLELSMIRELVGEVEFKAQNEKIINEIVKGADWNSFLKMLPQFKTAYQAWYSESLAVIGQLLPDRLDDFRNHYTKPKSRKRIDFESYRIEDYMQGLRTTRTDFEVTVIVEPSAALPHLRSQIGILKAAKNRLKSSLFEIRQLVQADIFDSEIDSARELLKHNFLRAAGAVAGVVLEKHLLQVCQDHNITIRKKNPGIADLNELLKANDVIEIPEWRKITHLGDLRNLCDHNKKKEPTEEQVSDLIDGVDRTIKNIA